MSFVIEGEATHAVLRQEGTEKGRGQTREEEEETDIEIRKKR